MYIGTSMKSKNNPSVVLDNSKSGQRYSGTTYSKYDLKI